MASILTTLRDAIADYLENQKMVGGFIFNDFAVVKSWMPISTLEQLAAEHPTGRVYLVGLASDDESAESRSNVCRREFQVMIGYQQSGVAPGDVELIDQLVELDEEIREACRRVDVPGYSWMRNEALKDQSGTAYSYVMLREAHTFESYFTAVFNVALA